MSELVQDNGASDGPDYQERVCMINRYSKQMLLSLINGVEGQTKLRNAKVVIIGAGGIGCGSMLYLAGAGVGTLGLVDFDVVSETNLHRQVLYDVSSIGELKVNVAARKIQALNPNTNCIPMNARLEHCTAVDLIRDYHVVIDATDNFEARYVLNDACVLTGKPLVSGSAVGLEGQVTVLNIGDGPCYRCLHPTFSAAESCRSCANVGVLGPVPGIVGTLQAVETIKLIIAGTQSSAGRPMLTRRLDMGHLIGKQLYYDALYGSTDTFTLPKRKLDCKVCSSNASIKSMDDSLRDMQSLQKCVVNSSHVPSVSVLTYAAKNGESHLLLDVRNEVQFNMVNLGMTGGQGCGALLNISLERITSTAIEIIRKEISDGCVDNDIPIYVLCRRGINSKLAVQYLLKHDVRVIDIEGGLEQWTKHVDSSFPLY